MACTCTPTSFGCSRVKDCFDVHWNALGTFVQQIVGFLRPVHVRTSQALCKLAAFRLDNDMTQFELRCFEKDGYLCQVCDAFWDPFDASVLGTWLRLQPAIYAMQDAGPLPERADVALALKAAPTARAQGKPGQTGGGIEPVMILRESEESEASEESEESDTFEDLENLEGCSDVFGWVQQVLWRFSAVYCPTAQQSCRSELQQFSGDFALCLMPPGIGAKRI